MLFGVQVESRLCRGAGSRVAGFGVWGLRDVDSCFLGPGLLSTLKQTNQEICWEFQDPVTGMTLLCIFSAQIIVYYTDRL